VLALLSYAGLVYVVSRQGLRGNRLNQVFTLYLITMALWQLAYVMVTLSSTPEGALFWYGAVVAVVSGQFVVYSIFVNTLLRVRSRPWLLRVGLVVWSATMIWALSGREPSFYAGIRQDEATGLFVPIFGPIVPLVAAPNYLFLGYAVANLVRAFRRTRSALQKSRIQYLLLGVAVVVLGQLANFVPAWQPYPIDVGANIANALFIAYAIYRYQFLNIRLVLRKGLLYSIPTVIIGTAYFLSAYAAVRFFHLVAGQQLVVSLAMGAITAAAVEPLRQRVQLWVDRLFFREQYDSSLMLQALSQAAASVLDLEKLSGMILDAITTTMHIERAAIFLRQEGTTGFFMVAQRGMQEGVDIRLRDDHPVSVWLREHEGILTWHDIELFPVFRSLWGQEKEDLERLQAELLIALKVKGELLGIFVVGKKLSEQGYSPAERLTLSTLANQTAVGVENARLYATEHRRVRESLVLLDIAAAVASTLDLDQVLGVIAQRTAEACGAHRCSILLLDESGDRVLPLMSQLATGERHEELWERFRRSTYVQSIQDVPILRRVIEEKETLILDSRTVHALPATWVEPFGIRTVALVPLVSRDRVVGILALDQMEDSRAFSEEQVNLAMTIGGQTAAAIESARLYDQTIQEKARTEAILRETSGGIVVLDENLLVVSMNPGAEIITDCPAHEAEGKAVTEVLGVELSSVASPLREATGVVRRPPVETVLHTRGGARDVLLGVTSLAAGSQAAKHYLLSFTDISKLKEVDRLKSSIVANVSHELRTPLASIKAYTELLLAGAEGDDAQLRDEWLAVIDQATDRVTTLVDDILSLARLESERVELRRELLDIGELVTSALSMLRVQADARKIAMRATVQDRLDPFWGDRRLLETIIKNLAHNAIKFSHDGGRVMLSVWEEPGVLKLSVKDEGIGIPADAVPHLFNKFFRVASTDAAAVQGTGLGLALVKEAVAAHGGHIDVESAPGEGSCFTVTLPLAHSSSVLHQTVIGTDDRKEADA